MDSFSVIGISILAFGGGFFLALALFIDQYHELQKGNAEIVQKLKKERELAILELEAFRSRPPQDLLPTHFPPKKTHL